MVLVQKITSLVVLVVLGLLGYSFPAVEANRIPAKGGRCVEGSTWIDDCNSCACSNGVPICTLQACPPQVDRCTEGHSKPSDDGCNTCKCVNGVYACTRKVCPDQEDWCIDGAIKDDGCNTCVCENGRFACTEAYCPPQVERCTEGHTKPAGDGCNTCICTGGRYGCTEIGCGYQNQAAWRDDFKCGLEHLAPNGQPAQCDPYGKFPCCSEWGWCGKSGDHCECTDCVDHRGNDGVPKKG